MRKNYRCLCLFMTIILIIPMLSIHAFADEIDDIESGYIADDCVRLTDESYYGDGVGLESSYDPRTYGLSTDVKDQNNSQLCWMFSAVGSEEQFVMRKFGRKLDISDIHGAAALSDCIINEDYYNSFMPGVYSNPVNTPGKTSNALQYFSNWNSPICSTNIFSWKSNVYNEDYPDSIMDDDYSFIHHNYLYLEDYDYAFSTSGSIVNLTDTKFISKDRDTVKKAIRDYAAVQAEIYIDKNFLVKNNSIQSYYSNHLGNTDSKKLNHAISIVGWDDDYPKENFSLAHQPANNGAWLVRNSWSDNRIDAGYIWVSYEENSFSVNTNNFGIITGMRKPSDNEYMLSYDYLPLKANSNSTSSIVYMANIYDVSNFINDYDEINQVMFYYMAKNCTYNIRIIPVDNSVPTNVGSYAILATGQVNGEGYTTATLSSPYELDYEYDKYAIIIEFVPNSSNSSIYLPAESSEYNNVTSQHVGAYEINSNESLYFVDSNGAEQIEWIDNKTIHPYNNGGSFCIRPVLHNTSSNSHYSSVSPNQVNNAGNSIVVSINSDSRLFSIHDSTNRVLYEDIDYTVNGDNVTLLSAYVNSIERRNTTLYFEFNNEMTRTMVINKKATLSDVSLSGTPLVGDTLYSSVVCNPTRESYDVDYQWQNSTDGLNWNDIPNAVNSTYSVCDDDFLKYLRVVVSAEENGNTLYPKTVISSSTNCKAVILGDVSLDATVSISDATLIQLYCADMQTFSNEQALAADVNRDGNININDITKLQRIIAGLE